MSDAFSGRYAAYQSELVGWAGETPSHWMPTRNKDIFAERGSLSLTGEEILLTVSHITGVTRRSEKNVSMFMAETMEGYKQCKKGDLVINTMWAWMGALGTATEDGICSPAYGVYAPRRFVPYSPRFFDYLYRTSCAISEMTRNSKGIVSSRLRLYPKEFFQILTALPPYQEQVAIANYLDVKTLQIDREIDLLGQKAAEYRKLKQSLINETVTRGLDKSVSKKSSGVDWIGEIPLHWSITRVKDLAKSTNGGAFKDDLVDIGLPIIKIQQLTLGCDATEFCSPRSPKLKDGNRLRCGDLVFSWSTLIAPFIYTGKDGVLNQHIFKISHSRRTHRGWLYYKLYQSTARLMIFAHGSTMQHILKSDFDNLEMETPPFAEQVAIASFLDMNTSKIDRIVTAIDAKIGTLKDLRKSLVNHVVTGKIKVVSEG